MRLALAIFLVLLSASAALAQAQPQQPAQAPQQVSGNYYPDPYYVPPAYVPAPQQQAPAAPTHAQAQPWDYGHSITTDIRQMNF